VLLTVLNVPLMVEASALIEATRPTVISPNMTAYSTAVGPSSLNRNRAINRSAQDIVKFSEWSEDGEVELVRTLTQILGQNDGLDGQTKYGR
jgi:hypothetical protein